MVVFIIHSHLVGFAERGSLKGEKKKTKETMLLFSYSWMVGDASNSGEEEETYMHLALFMNSWAQICFHMQMGT